jgi:TRAP-type C4-dicarboxylate transport system substrate-binding protein
MNKKTWEGLSAAHKKIIDDTRPHLSLAGAQAYDKKSAEAVDFMKSKGREVIRVSEAEELKMRKAAQPIIEGWIAEMEKQNIPGRAMWEARLKVQ